MSGTDQVDITNAALSGGFTRQHDHVSRELLRKRNRESICIHRGFRSRRSCFNGVWRLINSNHAFRQVFHFQIIDVDEVLSFNSRRVGFRWLWVHCRRVCSAEVDGGFGWELRERNGFAKWNCSCVWRFGAMNERNESSELCTSD